jgi:hypothetical protein
MGLFTEPIEGRSCWMCEHWQVENPRPTTITCLYGGSMTVKPNPERACAMFARATGSDDESGLNNAQGRPWR